MYFHLIIETKEKVGSNNSNRKFFDLDRQDLQEIKEEIIIPFFENIQFQFGDYFIKPEDVLKIEIKKSEQNSEEMAKIANSKVPPDLIIYYTPEKVIQEEIYTEDITKEVLKESKIKTNRNSNLEDFNEPINLDKSKVFIVHGHDNLAKEEVARFVEKLGLEAIILHEQISSGKTIIEKIEEFSNVGFAIVLYTPCDVGYKKDNEKDLKLRARQNVVFEHGFLMGKIGRKNVCALVKDNIETPNDISGVVYIPMDYHKAWQLVIAKEMRNVGYIIDMNVVV